MALTHAQTDRAAYALGERVPANVYSPANAAELMEILRRCDDAGEAAVLFGGNSLQALGNAPQRFDAAIDLRGLDRILEHEPRNLTISLEAGVTVAALDAALLAHRQFIPLDAPHPGRATVGGTLASGWLGPRRATYGRSRDFVIGATAALADGTLAKTGGMVVKNVTGYDLAKLYIGSLGTLAAIVSANFKTLPLPVARRVALAALPEGTRARAAANLASLAREPAAALMVRGFTEIDGRPGPEGRLLVLLEGSRRTVDLATRELRSALGSAGVPETRLLDREAGATFANALDAYVALVGERSATFRSGGSLDDVAQRAALLADAAAASEFEIETIEDLCTADVVARISAPSALQFRERLAEFEARRRAVCGGARVLAAPRRLRQLLEGFSDEPPSLATMRALKERFDPRGTLAPGRFVGGI
jgi:glycolate oxidase FAD binding subunit